MKVVFASTMMPVGHYSQILTEELSKQKNINLIVYSDKNSDNLKIKGCGKIKNVWNKGIGFGSQIFRELKKDRPDIIHLQHEFNMYGGMLTAVVFPLFVLWLRIFGYKVVVTVHSVVPKKEINKDFIALFNIKPILAKPFLFKMVFAIIFTVICRYANRIIVHTEMMKKALIFDYGSGVGKIQVVETAIPKSSILPRKKSDYFFYFGYLVRRKGLGYVLDGFSDYISKHPRSKYRLILAGGAINGQEKSRDEILQSIKVKGLEKKVEYVGFIDLKQQDELYSNAYAVILPAKISIAASGPLYYSYSYRRCPLASNVGNLKEEVKNNQTGILVANKKWSQAFEYAVNHRSVIRKIETNIDFLAERRSPLATAEEYANIYSGVFKQ